MQIRKKNEVKQILWFMNWVADIDENAEFVESKNLKNKKPKLCNKPEKSLKFVDISGKKINFVQMLLDSF